jgi:acetyl esterase
MVRPDPRGRALRVAAHPSPPHDKECVTHDFMMLNPLSATRATRAAVAPAIATLRQALHTT